MSDMSINGIGAPLGGAMGPAVDQPQKAAKGFMESMTEAIGKVEADEAQANQSAADLAVGNRKTLHETMIAVEKADVSFRMLLAVRNKMVSAYQEIMRMHF